MSEKNSKLYKKYYEQMAASPERIPFKKVAKANKHERGKLHMQMRETLKENQHFLQ